MTDKTSTTTQFTWTRYHVEQVAWYFAENPDKWTLDNNPPFAGINLYSADLRSADLWKVIIRWQWLPGVIVPFNTDGKIRCERVELVEIVREVA